MKDYMVSVIVPVYNVEEYIEKCMGTLLNQGIEIEVILVDDGSTDNSAQICKKFISENVIFIHQENKGVSAARNTGLKVARGKYIGFVDPDDWIEKGAYAALLKKAEQQSSDIVISDFYIDCGRMCRKSKMNIDEEVLLREEIEGKLLYRLIGKNYLGKNNDGIMGSVWRCLFRAEHIKENNIRFDTELCFSEDLIFLLEAIRKSRIISIDRNAYYHYVIRKGSAIRKYNPKLFDNYKKIIGLIKKKTGESADEKINLRLELLTSEALIHCVINEVKHYNKETKNNIERICEDDTFKKVINKRLFNSIDVENRIWICLISKKNVIILRAYGCGLSFYKYVRSKLSVLKNACKRKRR